MSDNGVARQADELTIEFVAGRSADIDRRRHRLVGKAIVSPATSGRAKR
jgi:hypothetical protein